MSLFYGCSSLTKVYYGGTAIDGEIIWVDAMNAYLRSEATWYYYSEQEPTEDGNYWHYDEDGNIVDYIKNTEGLIAAKALLDFQYKNAATETAKDYNLLKKVTAQGITFDITWSVTVATEGMLASDFTIVDASETEVTVQLPEFIDTVVEYTITATITDGVVTGTLSYDRTLPKYVAEFVPHVGAPVVGQSYDFAIIQENLGKTLYFAGAMDGYYYATTDDPTASVLVTVEDAGDGKFYLSFMNGDVKNYLNIYDRDGKAGSSSLSFVTENASPFEYDATLDLLFVTTAGGYKFYLGTNGTYKIFSTLNLEKYPPSETNFKGLLGVVPDAAPPVIEDPVPVVTGETKTIAEFVALDDSNTVFYYIEGVISSIAKAEYGNIYITDGTNTLYVYGLASAQMEVNDQGKFVNPKDFSTLGLKVGDKVRLVSAVGSYNGTKQAVGSGLVEKLAATAAEQVAAVKGDLTIKVSVTDSLDLTTDYPASVSITWASDNEAITIADGVATVTQGTEDVVVKLTATIKSGDIVDTKEFDVTVEARLADGNFIVTKTVADLATANGWENGVKYGADSAIALDNVVSAQITQTGSNSGKYYTSNNSWRIYGSESGELTITVAEGYELVSIKVTSDNSDTLMLNGIDVCNTITAVTGTSVTLVASNGRVDITEFEIAYKVADTSANL